MRWDGLCDLITVMIAAAELFLCARCYFKCTLLLTLLHVSLAEGPTTFVPDYFLQDACLAKADRYSVSIKSRKRA